jgi:excinuclease ABC subunit C
MLGAKGEPLYVGKARSLKKRVTAYAKFSGHTNRIQRMIAATTAMEFISTQTETEALLLEANLIKSLKPRYNVLLRDDKSFAHILIEDGPWPLMRKHRGARREKGRYFGPFASAGAVNRTLNQMQKAFLLRTCSDAVFHSRTRPCLLHQIKRCCAPCVGLVTPEEYADLAGEAARFLEGRSTRVQGELATRMADASAAMEFERAAVYRDRIRAMALVQAHQGINPRITAEADVVALHREGAQACVQVFFFRSHQNWGNRAYFPRISAEAGESEILEAFLGQFYAEKTPPRMVLLSHPAENGRLVADALSAIAGRRVSPRHAECPRGDGPQTGGERIAGQTAGWVGGSLRPRPAAPADRGLRQQPHSRCPCGRGDDRCRAGGIREIAIPQIQYQGRRPDPRR